ncbi:MAG TPA: hypothetical protein DD405_06025 [Desulfobacteraceae bacterium]|nr:hypothetical protein [Desulfobacteraceae bacterium]
MKILIHICCAGCSIYPVKLLRKKDFNVTGFFYNHNIHPYTECLKRKKALEDYARTIDLRVIWQKGYNLEIFLQSVVFREADRCTYCYHDRLKAAAHIAKRGKFDFFTSTLLYSKFQNHKKIKEIGISMGKSVGVPFFYNDFRDGWKEGIKESKELNLYRQQYCGCIFSEKERFYKE